MEKVKVFWKSRAISQLKKLAKWYSENLGTSSADKFWNGIITAGDLLSENPFLGKTEPILKDFRNEYRSLIQHKDYKIIYFIDTERNIQIVSIWHCPKKNP